MLANTKTTETTATPIITVTARAAPEAATTALILGPESTTFPFQRLRKELQLMIWEAAIDNIPMKYESYQLPVPAWKFFNTQPWHWSNKDTTWLRLEEAKRKIEEGATYWDVENDKLKEEDVKKIYMRPNWPSSELGRLCNVCVESRWCVMKWFWRSLEESGRTEHGQYLVKERKYVLEVLGSVVDELSGRLRG